MKAIIAVVKFVVWLIGTLIGGVLIGGVCGYIIGAIGENVFDLRLYRYGAGGHPELNTLAHLILLGGLVYGVCIVGRSLWKVFFGN